MTNKEAIEHLKSIIEFYKVGDPDNFDYTDKDLISIKIVLDILDKAIEILSEDFRNCPMSLTLEKSYIIEQDKIKKALNILKGSEE